MNPAFQELIKEAILIDEDIDHIRRKRQQISNRLLTLAKKRRNCAHPVRKRKGSAGSVVGR
ncbi:hypothetical protein BDA99DRAFT_516108, partial [Phascolomyces articulosus]